MRTTNEFDNIAEVSSDLEQDYVIAAGKSKDKDDADLNEDEEDWDEEDDTELDDEEFEEELDSEFPLSGGEAD